MENYNVNYSVHLPSYSIGPDCYNEVPYVTRFFGKTAVVLGGETAMEKAKPALLKGVEGSDVELLGFLPYGGDSTYENGDALIANPLVQKADMIFAMGRQVSRVCTDPLVQYGKEALASIRNKTASFALDQVTLDIIVSTGIVSNMMTTVNDYYYNSTLAHCVYYGSTVTEHGHHHLHGEVVSLGVLCLLEHDGQFEEEDRLMKFNDSIGLPVCFDDVEIQESEFDKMADKFMQTTEWAHMPQGVTRENFLESMRRENAKGRAFKAAKK